MFDSKKLKLSGSIYVVATPIGNLNDLSPRAQQVLSEVDLIAAEDTRHSEHLLRQFNINTPMTAYHEHNELEKTDFLIAKVSAGSNIAIISDAGTPLISDPGFRLIARAREQGIKVVPIPGPCAAIAALSVSGLPTDKFLFIGFLPAKSTARKKELLLYKESDFTVVIYESSHRIVATLEDINELYPVRKLTLARELTKTFETILSGTAAELSDILQQDSNQQKGEFVLVLAPVEKKDSHEAVEAEHVELLALLLEELPLKKAVTLAAKITGERKNQLYDLALKMSK